MVLFRGGSDRNERVSWLATTFVVLGGLASCTFIALSSASDPLTVLSRTAATVLAALFILWLISDWPRRTCRLLREWLGMRNRKKVAYRAVKQVAPPAPPPRLQPPTAGSIRELKEHQSVWVPSNRNIRRQDAE